MIPTYGDKVSAAKLMLEFIRPKYERTKNILNRLKDMKREHKLMKKSGPICERTACKRKTGH